MQRGMFSGGLGACTIGGGEGPPIVLLMEEILQNTFGVRGPGTCSSAGNFARYPATTV